MNNRGWTVIASCMWVLCRLQACTFVCGAEYTCVLSISAGAYLILKHAIVETELRFDRYRISSKSRCGGILFQGSIWCGDNSRVARFRGRHLQRSTRTRLHSFNDKPSVKYACAYGYCYQPLTMRRDFESGVYWDKLADRCGDISGAAGFRGAARF